MVLVSLAISEDSGQLKTSWSLAYCCFDNVLLTSHKDTAVERSLGHTMRTCSEAKERTVVRGCRSGVEPFQCKIFAHP